jgi:arylsulfatase A-like enzyme
MDRRTFLKHCAVSAGALTVTGCEVFGLLHQERLQENTRPHIIYILADDLGYGDVSCFNKESKIHTPHLDQLAKEGMVFTDAHSGSAVCTPTRYGILTGRYSWRSRLKEGVLFGQSEHLIEEGRMTVASMLKSQGYRTACIGKWHLGWDWQMTKENPSAIDFSQPVQNGPLANGFDYCFCLPASLDMPPYVYLENDRVTAVPDRVLQGQTGKKLFREGPAGADFEPIEVLPKMTEKAVAFIEGWARGPERPPLFLYLALPAPHTPILPTKEFQGKSGTNEYGDFVLQIDSTVGQVMNALKRSGIEKETLVIFTSDNGCAPAADFEELERLGHDPSYVFRGYKTDIFEGGHRMPYITRWPSHIRPGRVCDDTICLTDLMATAADIVGITLPDNAGEDSVSILPDMLGTAAGPLRQATVHHSVNGSFSIRQGRWKLVLCSGSGGWSPPKPNSREARQLPPVQLYDLSRDIAETTNVQDKYPEVVKELTALLESYVRNGRSTPGVPQKNNGKVNLYP